MSRLPAMLSLALLGCGNTVGPEAVIQENIRLTGAINQLVGSPVAEAQVKIESYGFECKEVRHAIQHLTGELNVRRADRAPPAPTPDDAASSAEAGVINLDTADLMCER